MEAPAWITIAVFITAVIFSIVMASISGVFREFWMLKEVWHYVMFFLILVTSAVLLTMSVQCSGLAGKYDEKSGYCKSYAWMLTVLCLGLLSLYMTHAIINHIDAKNHSVEENDNKILPTIRVYTESS